MATCVCEDQTDVELDKVVFYAVFADGHLLYHDEDEITVFRSQKKALEWLQNNVTPESQVIYTIAKYSVCNDDAREKSNYVYKAMYALVPECATVLEDTTTTDGISYGDSWDL